MFCYQWPYQGELEDVLLWLLLIAPISCDFTGKDQSEQPGGETNSSVAGKRDEMESDAGGVLSNLLRQIVRKNRCTNVKAANSEVSNMALKCLIKKKSHFAIIPSVFSVSLPESTRERMSCATTASQTAELAFSAAHMSQRLW